MNHNVSAMSNDGINKTKLPNSILILIKMMIMENMKKIEVKGRFIVSYSDEWKEKKVVGCLKKGMTLDAWIENKALYDAKKEKRDKLIRQLIHFASLTERRRDPSHFINQCLTLERELDSLMTVK